MTIYRPFPLRKALVAGLLATSAFGLAGCKTDRVVAESYPQNYEQRHPIVLAEGSARLDLPAGAGHKGLTDRQKEDIRAFAADWRKNGRGPVGMLVPAGGPGAGGGDYAVPAIRSTLASAGVPTTSILSQRYHVDGSYEIAPVKLGFVKLKAEVPHPCGLWPDDIGHGNDMYGALQNNDYWNFGCATQQNLAAQVADPEDLARPRAETPIYAARRQGVTEKYRTGEDTSTSYRQTQSTIATVGSSN